MNQRIRKLIISGLVLVAVAGTCTFCSNIVALGLGNDGWPQATAIMQQVTASSRLMSFLVTIAFGPTCGGLAIGLSIVAVFVAWLRLHSRGGSA